MAKENKYTLVTITARSMPMVQQQQFNYYSCNSD